MADARNNVISYIYDNMDRVERRRRDALLRDVVYEYHAGGLIKKVTDRRLCGPLAGSQLQHRPGERHRPKISKLEAAYHKADKAIDDIIEILQAA